MNVTVSEKHKKLVLPWRDDIAAILPQTTRLVEAGKAYAVVPHGVIETKLLRNMGLEVPAPILTQYQWAKTTPWDSQKVTAAMFSTEPRAYCLSSMGVGKTRAALYAYDFLKKQGLARKMLVVAPLSTLTDVWEREVFENFYHLSCLVLHGTKAQRRKKLEEPVDIYVINHDGVATIINELIDAKFDIVCIDELAAFRNAGTKRWKILNTLINRQQQNPVVWGMTGAPTPNAPTDAYGQVKLITPSQVPRSFRRFQLSTMTQVTQFKWVAKHDANDTVRAAMKPSIRYTLDECHDIPETIYSMRHIEPSATQKSIYKKVFDHFRAEYKGNDITAVNEGAKLNKLLQISAGFAYSEGKGTYIDAKPRLKELVELIEQADKKVLVFASYKWIIRALEQILCQFYSVEVITGDTKRTDRDRIFTSFRKSADPHVIVAHAGTMAHGLTLVEADTIIWYGPTMSSELYEQANARIRRPGQTQHTHVIHIESTPVEKKAFQRLKRKQKLQGLLLSMFEEDVYV